MKTLAILFTLLFVCGAASHEEPTMKDSQGTTFYVGSYLTSSEAPEAPNTICIAINKRDGEFIATFKDVNSGGAPYAINQQSITSISKIIVWNMPFNGAVEYQPYDAAKQCLAWTNNGGCEAWAWSVTSVSGKWSKHCCLCDNYLFKPMKDITAYELSLILELIWGKDIEDLTCEEFRSIKRHLKCND